MRKSILLITILVFLVFPVNLFATDINEDISYIVSVNGREYELNVDNLPNGIEWNDIENKLTLDNYNGKSIKITASENSEGAFTIFTKGNNEIFGTSKGIVSNIPLSIQGESGSKIAIEIDSVVGRAIEAPNLFIEGPDISILHKFDKDSSKSSFYGIYSQNSLILKSDVLIEVEGYGGYGWENDSGINGIYSEKSVIAENCSVEMNFSCPSKNSIPALVKGLSAKDIQLKNVHSFNIDLEVTGNASTKSSIIGISGNTNAFDSDISIRTRAFDSQIRGISGKTFLSGNTNISICLSSDGSKETKQLDAIGIYNGNYSFTDVNTNGNVDIKAYNTIGNAIGISAAEGKDAVNYCGNGLLRLEIKSTKEMGYGIGGNLHMSNAGDVEISSSTKAVNGKVYGRGLRTCTVLGDAKSQSLKYSLKEDCSEKIISSISIDKDNVTVNGGKSIEQVRPTVKDNQGEDISDEVIIAVSTTIDGASINDVSGDKDVYVNDEDNVICIEAKAMEGEYTIEARPIRGQTKGNPVSIELHVKREESRFAGALASQNVTVTFGTKQGFEYKLSCWDQYGNEMIGNMVFSLREQSQIGTSTGPVLDGGYDVNPNGTLTIKKWSGAYGVTMDYDTNTVSVSDSANTAKYNIVCCQLSDYAKLEEPTPGIGIIITIDSHLNITRKLETHTVFFNPQDSSIGTESKSVTLGEKYGELPVINKEGYSLEGWYTDPNNGELITKETIVTIRQNQTLYAHWKHTAHVYDKEIPDEMYLASSADCDNCARYYKSCVCGKASSSDAFEYGNPRGHINRIHYSANSPTCTALGNSEYWSCSDCGKYFSDEASTQAISENAWIIQAINHKNKIHHAAKEATTSETGNSEYWSCPDCHKYFSDEACTNIIAEYSWIIPKKDSGGGGGGAAGGGSSSEEQNDDKESNVNVTSTATDAKGDVIKLETKIDSSKIKSDKAVIKVSTSGSTNISNLSLDVPKELVADVVSNGTKLEISTPIDTITFDAKALTSIGNGDFTVTVGTKFNTEDTNKATQTDYSITLKHGSTMITNFGNGNVEVVLPIPGGLSSKSDAKVLYDDGKFFTDMNGIVSGSKITFQTNHFSKYSVMDASSAKTKLIKSVKSSTVGTPKLSAKKKKITLSWKNGKGNTPSKYYIYRSLKKTKGFSKIATIKNTSKKYTDSKKLKKGKTYYYKVVGVVNVDNKWYNTKSSAIKGIKCK